MRAGGIAADKILAHDDLDEETAVFAFRSKMTSLQALGHLGGDDAALEEAIRFARSYLADPRSQIATEARNQLLLTRTALIGRRTSEEQQEFLRELSCGKYLRTRRL